MSVRLRDRGLATRIGATVRAVEPAACILLFGSRARARPAASPTGKPSSSWLDGPVDGPRRDVMERTLYELGLETGAVIASLSKDAAIEG